MSFIQRCKRGLGRGVRGVVLGALTLGVLVGCSSTYVGGYDYQPRPVDLEIGRGAHMLLTVNGIRRAEKDGLGEAVEAVIRIENGQEAMLRVDPGGISLTTANLITLPARRVTPAGPQTIAVGQTLQLTALFELPKGEGQAKADLDGLSLRVVVQRGEDSFSRTATFSLDKPDRRGRGNMGFGVGVGIGL